MQKKYNYIAFGYNIESNFECQLLTKLAHTTYPDIIFKRCNNSFFDISHDSFAKGNVNYFEINIQNIIQFKIINGKYIEFYAPQNIHHQTIQLYLLGSAIGALLHQTGRLPFHGSIININNIGVLISGESGAGKSTLAAKLMQLQYKILTDDVAALTANSNNVIVYPSYAYSKLWNNSIEMLNINLNNSSELIAEPGKFNIPAFLNFYSNPIDLKYIFILNATNNKILHVSELKGIEKFNKIKECIYRISFLNQIANTKHIFDVVSTIAKLTKVYTINRPIAENSVNKIAEIVLNTVSND